MTEPRSAFVSPNVKQSSILAWCRVPFVCRALGDGGERLSEGEKLAFGRVKALGGLGCRGLAARYISAPGAAMGLILDQAAIAGLLVRSLLSVLTRQMILEEIALISDARGIE
jgi:hypothetical protein